METMKFILNYFSARNIMLLTAFLCREVDIWKLSKASAEANIRIRIIKDSSQVVLLPTKMRQGLVLDLQCKFSKKVIEMASGSRGFHNSYSWLLVDESPRNSTKMEEYLKNVALYPDADVVWAFTDKIVDVYKVKFNYPLVTTNLGLNMSSSSNSCHLFWTERPTLVTRRKDLMNISMNAAVIVSKPQYFKGWDDLKDKQIDGHPKTTYPLMKLLMEDLNMTYNLRQLDDYGSATNNTFDGMMGYIQRGEIEIGITSSFMRSDRWDIVDFSSETVQFSSAIVFRQPSQSYVSNIFLLPLSTATWLSTVIVISIAALFLLVAAVTLKTLDQRVSALTSGEIITCQQGYHFVPNRLSLRITMFFTLLFAFFVFTAYAAKIVAILQAPSNALQTITDLANSPMTCAIQDTTYKKVYFAESKDPQTKYLYRKKILPLGESAYMSVSDGVAQMRKGLFAFQMEKPAGYEVISKTFSQQEKCGLKEIEAYKTPIIAIPFKKYSGYQELVASRMRWQREISLMSRTSRLWVPQKPTCDDNRAGFVSVGLLDVLPAFNVLLNGMGLSIGLFSMEWLWSKVHLYRFIKTCLKY